MLARTPPLPTMMQRRQLRLREKGRDLWRAAHQASFSPTLSALVPRPSTRHGLGEKKTNGLPAVFLRRGQRQTAGSWAAWNAQTCLAPGTCPGKHGRGKGSDVSSVWVRKEALVRWHSGLKVSQELAGVRQLSGRDVGRSWRARPEKREQRWTGGSGTQGRAYIQSRSPHAPIQPRGTPTLLSLQPLTLGVLLSGFR